MKKVLAVCVLVCLISGSAFADSFGTDGNQFDIEFVPISGATNPTSGYGIVNNDYRIGKFEITNDQWNKFKANIAPMQVTGSPSSAYDENPSWMGTNLPTNNVSWLEAAQFVNWLNTSKDHAPAYKFIGEKGNSTYEFTPWEPTDAGYDPDNPYRNSEAYYFIPTEDEWVKAAYWNGTSLQTFATPDDTLPVKGVESNYHNVLGQSWDVGSGSEELNGTFDMMGNVWEWTETLIDVSNRSLGGGCYANGSATLSSSSSWGSRSPDHENSSRGFRVASVPEPACALLFLAGIGFIRRRKYRV